MKRRGRKKKAWLTLEKNISIERFNELIHPLIGFQMSRAWRGYGSALFLEFGKLTQKGYPSGRPMGEAGVMIEWSWRVETPRAIRFGSFNTNAKMDHGINALNGTVQNISLFGRLPEISIQLSGDTWVNSFMTANGQPDWTIFLLDQTWLSVWDGRIIRGRDRIRPARVRVKRH